MVLGPRNMRQHGARRGLLVINSQPAHDRLDKLLLIGLVVNDEALAESNRRLPRSSRWNPQRLDIAPQHAHAKRMKSRDDGLSDGKAANQLVDPFNHLRGSFVGERHCQNGLRHHPQMLDQMGNAVSNDARLPAARARKDEHRAFGSLDGLTLLRVELGEKGQ